MTIMGLTTILGKDCTHFEPLHLRNTDVVINAHDFCGWLYKPLPSSFGGEYLAFHLEFQHILENFKKCNITPYFVLPGCYEFRGDELQHNLYRMSTRLNSFVESGYIRPDDQTMPFLSNHSLQEALRQFNVAHVRPTYCSPRTAIALAAHLRCPLLTCTSDHFLLTNRAALASGVRRDEPPVVPIYLITNEAVVGAGGDPFLSAHAFRLHLSELKCIQPTHMPLFIAILGCNRIRCRLPSAASAYLHQSTEMSDHPKENRMKALIKWFSDFPAGSMKPAEDLIAGCMGGEERNELIRKLVDVLAVYIYNPNTEGQQIASILKLSKEAPTPALTTRESEIIDDSEIGMHSLFELLKGNVENTFARPDYTVGWPSRVKYAFQQSRVFVKCLQPLYLANGALCHPVMMENLDSESSVHEPALPLRLFHYQLLAGLEEHLGQREKLIGLRPNAVEYARRGNQVKCFEIPVQPLPLDYTSDYTDQVLTDLLGFKPHDQMSEPEWGLTMAVTLSVWHERNRTTAPSSPPLDQDPVLLAVLIVAVVTDHMDKLNQSVLQHFNRIADTLEQENSRSRPSMELVHLFVSLQVVYKSLFSLVHLVESLLPFSHESEWFHFPPSWMIFPSGRLVYLIASQIAASVPLLDRRRNGPRFWIPKICKLNEGDDAPSSANQLCSMVTAFDRIITLAMIVRPRPLPRVHVSIRDVAVESHSSGSSYSKNNRGRFVSPTRGGPASRRASLPIKPSNSHEFPALKPLPDLMDSLDVSKNDSSVRMESDKESRQSMQSAFPFRGRSSYGYNPSYRGRSGYATSEAGGHRNSQFAGEKGDDFGEPNSSVTEFHQYRGYRGRGSRAAPNGRGFQRRPYGRGARGAYAAELLKRLPDVDDQLL